MEALKQRFLSKVQFGRPSACWPWTGAGKTGKGNYGRFQVGNRLVQATRFMWEMTIGKIPDGMLVCHICDNTNCVNPNHMFIGTIRDNSMDMRRKGRAYDNRGENHGNNKLKVCDVQKMLQLDKEGMEHKEIAKIIGVTACTVCDIFKGRSWSHLTGFPKKVQKKRVRD